MPTRRDDQAVFLNIPFDATYERMFVALVMSLLALGRKPRCVLELSEAGQGRLDRILRHIAGCRVSLHDLSRTGTPARFNMPFELGIAAAVAHFQPPHDFIILSKFPYRIDKVLSDVKRCDSHIHKGKPRHAVNCVLDALASPEGSPEPASVFSAYQRLWKVAAKLKAKDKRETVFSRSLFQRLVAAGLEIAVASGFIDS